MSVLVAFGCVIVLAVLFLIVLHDLGADRLEEQARVAEWEPEGEEAA